MKKKIRVGIDIDEILRAKWLQFDRFYVQEFGEEGVPEEPYSYDFFNDYSWEEVEEKTKELIEDDEILNSITPLDYQADEDGNVPADLVLFDTKNVKLSAIEVFNRFMYVDYCFEIFGTAPLMYKGLDYHFNMFHMQYNDFIELVIVSNENKQTIPPTLFFLSKMQCRVSDYKLCSSGEEKFNDIDILITTDPEILINKAPRGKKVIKVNRPYNELLDNCDMNILQLNDLVNNEEFEKMIKYKK